jgi:hypothetical protein
MTTAAKVREEGESRNFCSWHFSDMADLADNVRC